MPCASSGGLALVFLLSQALVLADDQQRQSGDDAAPAYRVQGRIVDEADRPVADAVVESLNEREQASAPTDDRGHFILDLPRKPSQVLLLRAVSDGGARQAFAGYLLDKNARFLWDGDVGLPEDLKLVLRPARQISVAVVDGDEAAGGPRPVADAHVFVNATSYLKLAEAQTDAAGKATLRVPVDAPLSSIVAMKSDVGFDYFYYQDPDKRDRHRIPRESANPVELVLNGVRPTTVQVIDDSGQPMPGVRVFPHLIQKPSKAGKAEDRFGAGVLSLFGITEIEVTTDDDGMATFDFLPSDSTRPVYFQTMARGYARLESAKIDVAFAKADVVIPLVRMFTLRVHVSLSDGRPAAGARVHVAWHPFERPFDKPREGWRRGRGISGSMTCYIDDRGFFTEFVSPNQVYELRASLDRQWAAPLAVCVVGAEVPKDDVRIVLERTTRVYGRLTAGPAKKPAAGQRLGIFRRLEVGGRDLSDGSWVSTGETGEFETFFPSGKYQILYDNQPLTEVELAGEP